MIDTHGTTSAPFHLHCDRPECESELPLLDHPFASGGGRGLKVITWIENARGWRLSRDGTWDLCPTCLALWGVA